MDEREARLKNAITTLGAKKPENGDYCRHFQEIIKVGEGRTTICKVCPIRCVHSGSKEEQDNLIKNDTIFAYLQRISGKVHC